MVRQVRNVIDYIAILFVILDCYSLISIVGANGEIVKISAIIFLIVSFGLHIIRGLKIKKSVMLFAFVYLALQLLFALINKPSSIVTYFLNQVLIVILMMLCFSNKNFLLDFWEKYRNIMLIICGFSVLFYFLGTVLSIIPPSGTVNASWGTMKAYKNWYYLYNESQGTWFLGQSLVRNIGIFAEAPMFSYCVCFALWYELFGSSPKKIRAIIFLLAIASAFSITGVMFAAAMLFIKYCEIAYRMHRKFTVKRLFMLIALVAVAIIGIFLVFDKLDSVSGVSRLNQYLNALNIWAKNPFIGVGYRMSTEGGFASGVLLAIVECGLLGSLVYFIPLIGATIKSYREKSYHYLAFTIGFAGILFLTVVPYKILTLCAVSYLWMYLFGACDDRKLAKG